MPTPTQQCLRCWTLLAVAKTPRVVCPECGCVQPHLSTDVGEFFDCLECSEPLDAPARDGRSELTCRICGARRSFVRGPMVVITGAPGVGKSVLGIRLAERLRNGVVLEPPASAVTERDSLTIMTMFKDWLVLGAQVAQGGRYLVLPSFARPDELDLLPERDWVGEIHWLALVCDADVLAGRLQSRRKSRTIDDEELRGLIGINNEIRAIANTEPHVTMLDTSTMTLLEVVGAAVTLIDSWVQ